ASCLLHTQIELVAQQTKQLLVQLLKRFLTKFIRFHHITVRLTKEVARGSFAAARANASRASSSGRPSISYSTLPGWIWAPQYSTPTLPLPIRTSRGFLLTGLSGNTRIQILPPRLTWRVSARRADSIWRAVRRPRETDFRANSPKLTLLPR